MPSHYYWSLYTKLQDFKEGVKSMGEYCQEMEMTMIWANIEEEKEAIMARFIAGLNLEIANKVEL